jgi:hypothetical protein
LKQVLINIAFSPNIEIVLESFYTVLVGGIGESFVQMGVKA